MPSSGRGGARSVRSDTAERRLVGAADADALARIAGELSTIPAVREIGPETAARLVARHGTEAPAVVALGAELGPAAAARPGPLLPRGRGRLGRPPRAGPLARRRPGAPDAAGPGAARPRRGHRPAGRRDPRRRARLGRHRASGSRSRLVPRDGAARVFGPAPGTARAAGRRGVDHDGLTASRRRHRPVMESAASSGDGVPGRPAARVLRRSVHVPDPGRGRVDGHRGRGPRDRLAGRLVRGGAAASRAGRGAARGRAGGGAAADLVPRVADLDPDRAGRAGAGRRRSRADADARPSPVGQAVTVAIGGRPRRRLRRPAADRRSLPRTVATGDVPRHRRLPLRSRHRHDRRDRARRRTRLRLADFSVRNGPDLFVYLSPDADDYDDGALELGRLKATDGAFGYDLPPGTDPADFASAIIWCKQFSHLFAVAPLAAD